MRRYGPLIVLTIYKEGGGGGGRKRERRGTHEDKAKEMWR